MGVCAVSHGIKLLVLDFAIWIAACVLVVVVIQPDTVWAMFFGAVTRMIQDLLWEK